MLNVTYFLNMVEDNVLKVIQLFNFWGKHQKDNQKQNLKTDVLMLNKKPLK